MSASIEFDPQQDIDCTRCNATCSWGDEGPPEDPEDRICNSCVWAELQRYRALRKKFEKSEVVRADDIYPAYSYIIDAPAESINIRIEVSGKHAGISDLISLLGLELEFVEATIRLEAALRDLKK